MQQRRCIERDVYDETTTAGQADWRLDDVLKKAVLWNCLESWSIDLFSSATSLKRHEKFKILDG